MSDAAEATMGREKFSGGEVGGADAGSGSKYQAFMCEAQPFRFCFRSSAASSRTTDSDAM